MPRQQPQQASIWDTPAVLESFRRHGLKETHLPRVWSALLKDPAVPWSSIPNLPKAAASLLDASFTRCSSRVLSCQRCASGDTTKLLVQLHDGLMVESVIMQYDTTERYSDLERTGWGHSRATLCVSSQVGCQFGCCFCATGTMGLKGSLSAGEIVEQLVHASRVQPIRNAVFMGMGEPLSNYDAVKAAIHLMTSRVFGLSRRHITVSTVGLIPRIRAMAADMPGVSLALSLHAPNQELRKRIVPSARAYPLNKLLAAVDGYIAASGQRVFVEYVLLSGVNDGDEQAHELGALLQHRNVTLNVIPWNPVLAAADGPQFAAPGEGRVRAFRAIVRGQYGVHCTVRQEKGQDIAGACGQLVIEHAGTSSRCCSSKDVAGDSSQAAATAAAAGGVRLQDIEELVHA